MAITFEEQDSTNDCIACVYAALHTNEAEPFLVLVTALINQKQNITKAQSKPKLSHLE